MSSNAITTRNFTSGQGIAGLALAQPWVGMNRKNWASVAFAGGWLPDSAFHSPDIPTAQPSVPVPEQNTIVAEQAAARARQRRGMGSTLLASQSEPTTMKKTLLGS
jgi:hypothetical protein